MNVPEPTYRLAGISVPSFSYSSGDVELNEEPDLDFTVGTELRFSVADGTVVLLLVVDAVMEEGGPSVVHIASETAFEIANMKDLVRNGEFHLPKEWAITFIAIGFSTLRGILNQRLAGTPFEDVLLPVIDPASLLSTDYRETIES